MDSSSNVLECPIRDSNVMYICAMYSIAIATFLGNIILAVLIIFHSSKSMGTYKCHLFYYHLLIAVTSLLYTVFAVPVILAPLPIVYAGGLFHKLKIPTTFSFWIFIFFIMQTILSTLYMFFNRYQIALPKYHRFKLVTGRYWLLLVLYGWLNVFYFVSLANADLKLDDSVLSLCSALGVNTSELIIVFLPMIIIIVPLIIIYCYGNVKKGVLTSQDIVNACCLLIAGYNLASILSTILFNRCYRHALRELMNETQGARKEMYMLAKILTILSVAGLVALVYNMRGAYSEGVEKEDVQTLSAIFPSISKDDGFNTKVVKRWDYFVVSAYYYNTSKSLGDDSIALIVSGHHSFPVRSIELVVSNGTKTKTLQIPLTKARENITKVCRMDTYVATIPTGIENLSSIAAKSAEGPIDIPIKIPVHRKHDAVACVSPLFTAEQWQEIIFSLHIYKRFGSHPHIYLRSIVQPIYKVLEFYQKEGYTTLEPWLRYAFPTVSSTLFNPNKEVEFRAQDAAHTDCLLKYKEAASFIFFVDIDDILIPKMAPTYFEEFAKVFAMQPNAKYFRYQKWNAAYKSTRNPSLFKVDRMLASFDYMNTTEYGKIIVRPEFINATWIHYPQGSAKMEWRNVSAHITSITHLKKMEIDDIYFNSDSPVSVPHYNLSQVEAPYWQKGQMNTTNLMSDEDFAAIKADYSRMRALPGMELFWQQLPHKPFYGPIVGACYKRIWYELPSIYDYVCTNADKCNLPKNPGVMCVNARAKYRSIVSDGIVNFHFATEGFFKEEDGCVP